MSNINFNTTLTNVSYDTNHVIKITGKRNIDNNDISFDISTTCIKKSKLNNQNSDMSCGKIKNNKPNDEKEMKYANGDIYNGYFKDDNRNGNGEMKYTRGYIYNGDWKDDKPYGKGEAKFSNGDIYNGDCKDGIPNGKGEIKFSNGGIYSGDWKDGNIYKVKEKEFIYVKNPIFGLVAVSYLICKI